MKELDGIQKKKILYAFIDINNKKIDYIDLSWFQI